MIVSLDDPRCADAFWAGGKGAGLARMAAADLRVPPGFVVLADVLAASLAVEGRERLLRDVLAGAGDDADLARVARDAQALVLSSPVEPGLAAAVHAGYAALGTDVAVAVRSSAASEDSAAASFAGQQETYLHVRGMDSVLARIRDCWASLFSERALFYRRRKGSLDDLRMAVVVQEMVEPDTAGILFTVDPVSRRRDQMLVEAVFGLGEAAVSGGVTPDHYVIRRDGRPKRVELSVQAHRVVRDPDGGTREEPMSAADGAARTLSEGQLAELAALGRSLEERFGGPQDIEWAIRGEAVYLLQSRPVTTL